MNKDLTREQFKKIQVFVMQKVTKDFPDLDMTEVMFMAMILATYQTKLESVMFSDERDSLVKMLELLEGGE